MKNETIDLGHGRIEVLINGNLIYFKVFGDFTNDDVLAMTGYLENFFKEAGGPTVRIWDSTNIAADQFKLNPKATNLLKQWSEGIKKKWPGNSAYLIADKPLIYGMSRMYELKVNDNYMPITVVREIDELPEYIRQRISRP